MSTVVVQPDKIILAYDTDPLLAARNSASLLIYGIRLVLPSFA